MDLYLSGTRLESGPASPTSPCWTEPGPAAAPDPEPELDDAESPLLYPEVSGARDRVIDSLGAGASPFVSVAPPLPSPVTLLSGVSAVRSPEVWLAPFEVCRAFAGCAGPKQSFE